MWAMPVIIVVVLLLLVELLRQEGCRMWCSEIFLSQFVSCEDDFVLIY